MIRVLHLSGVEPDLQTERSATALRSLAGPELRIESRRIGRGGDYRNAALAFLRLRRDRFKVLHAWDASALAVASLAAGQDAIVFSPSAPSSNRRAGWLGIGANHRTQTVVCATPGERRLIISRGTPADQCHVIAPGLEHSASAPLRDSALRAALGVGDDDHLLLCPGESTLNTDHELAVWTGAILEVLDPRHKILLWGRGPHAAKALRLAHRLRRPNAGLHAEAILGRPVDFSELVGIADFAILTATTPAPVLPIAMCMAAGLPIVGIACPFTTDLLEDRRQAVLAPKRSARLLAQHLLEVQQDTTLRRTIADGARRAAAKLFSMTSYCQRYDELYRRLAKWEPTYRSTDVYLAGIT